MLSRRGLLHLVMLGWALAAAEVRAQAAAPAPAAIADAPLPADTAAAIARRLLQAGQPPRCRETAGDGEIVVCGRRGASEKERLPLRDQLESARSTRDGVPHAPNVFGIGDIGGVKVSGCFLPPCPPPLMPDIDFAALPAAPSGSDADRIAKGEIPAP